MTITESRDTSRATAAEHYVVISADTHGGVPALDYRPYLEKKHHAALEEYAVRMDATYQAVREMMRQHLAAVAGETGEEVDQLFADFYLPVDESPAYDTAPARVSKLESDGIVGSVVFSGGRFDTGPPFAGMLGQDGSSGAELYAAGIRAYNRWLGDFCAERPDQLAGIGLLEPFSDPKDAAAQVHVLSDLGLRGGIMFPFGPADAPSFHTAHYDPLWAACEALSMPVNNHGGGRPPVSLYGDLSDPLAQAVAGMDGAYFSHRPLWLLMVGGVLDRFPGLKLVFTEQGAEWIVAELDRVEHYLRFIPFSLTIREHMQLKPAEYWARNCWVGASFIKRAEVERRYDLGVDRIMWGSDFPHGEGTYPHTEANLRYVFADVDPDELRLMLGANAAEVYGFDLERLQPIADRVGPTLGRLAEPVDDKPHNYII